MVKRETELLGDLRKEIEASIVITEQKIHSFGQVLAAGKRSLEFLSSGASCETECWPVLVDFMHASQWQALDLLRPTYNNLRRLGLPKDRAIIEAVEAYLAQADSANPVFAILPHYRTAVRQLVPLEAQEFYWLNCYFVDEGLETYVLDCPKGIADGQALNVVERIVQNSEIEPSLTQWASSLVMLPVSLGSQNTTGELAIKMIDAELTKR